MKNLTKHGLAIDTCNMPVSDGFGILDHGRATPGCIALGQGQGSAPTPDFIRQAGIRAIEDGQTFYTPSRGTTELREELRSYYSRIYKSDISLDRIIITPSGSTANFIAQIGILDPGDEVIIVSPIWQNLVGPVYIAGASPVFVYLDHQENGEWHLDMKKIYDAVTSKTKAIFVNSPSNPTSWIMPEAQIKELMSFARDKDLWVVSDEVYSRLTYDTDHAPSFIHHATPNDKLLIINTFSKTYAMTGWRLGWLVIPEFSKPVYDDLIRYNTLGASMFVQQAGITALRDGEAFLTQQLNDWQANGEMVAETLARYPNLRYVQPDCSFYAFFKLPEGTDDIAFAKRLIDEQGVTILPGSNFGASTKGYMRMCYAVERDIMIEALARLSRGLDSL